MENQELLVNDIWNAKKKEDLKKFISTQSQKQSKERLLHNRLLSIQYKLEDYINENAVDKQELRILDFVKMYLKALNITKNSLAQHFEMEPSNLHKYLTGERRMNAELAMKLSSFSHTKPEYWFSIQIKNELIKLRQEKSNLDEYKRFDYKNLVEI
jgi:addiction module HigA family antidote